MHTLIMCWNKNFIYITKKYNKTKNIKSLKITINKIKWNRKNTYILMWWRFTTKLARDSTKLEDLRGKNRNSKVRNVRNGGEEKMN